MKHKHRAIFCLVALLSFTACSTDDPTTATTTAATKSGGPVIQGVDATNLGSGIVGLHVRATDSASPSMSFFWHTNDGQLSATASSSIQWKPPKTPGTYAVFVDVSDDVGNKVTGTQSFTVAADGSATASSQLQVSAANPSGSGSDAVSGQFAIPSPVGNLGVQAPAVGADPAAPPLGTPAPSQPIFQPVATPNISFSTVPTAPPLQPLATPTPTIPPTPVPPTPVPTAQPPTPQPGVSQPPTVTWHVYDQGLIPLKNNLTALHFISSTEGWLVGFGGTVMYYHKTDANTEPALLARNGNIATSAVLRTVHFTSSTKGYISGDNGLVMRTADGGVSWEDISVPQTQTPGNFYAMHVINDQSIVVGDNQGYVWRTDTANGAANAIVWKKQPVKSANVASQAEFLTAAAGFQTDPTITYFIGDGVYQLDYDNPDPNQVWTKILNLNSASAVGDGGTTQGDGTPTTIQMPNQNELYVGTTTGVLLHMTRGQDGSFNWTRLQSGKYVNREFNGDSPNLQAPTPINAMSVLDSNNVFLNVRNGDVYDTFDGGKGWRSLSAGEMHDMQVMLDNGTIDIGFGVGNGGALYEYRSGP